MTNYRKAPRFYHNGTKVLGERFYQLPQQLMDIIFHKFDGKNGNVLKLLMVLIGTKGDGSFGISENWIKERTGIDKQNYHRSLDKLIALGYVTRENGKIILNLEAIMEDGHSEEQDSHRQSEEADQEAATFDSDDDRETTKIGQEGQHQAVKGTRDENDVYPDDDYNIKNKHITNNIINNMDLSPYSGESLWELLRKIRVDYSPNTIKTIMEIVGEEPDNEILFRMINEHSGEWEKARSMPQGYRFGMLKNMLTQEYHAWKRVMNGGHPWPDDKDGDAPFDIDEILDSMFVVHKVDPKAFRDEQPEPKVLSYDEEMMREYGMYDDFDADGL